MAWFEGEYKVTTDIAVPAERALEWFSNPDIARPALGQLASLDKVGDSTWRYVLTERNEKGIRFQPDYTVTYKVNGDLITWTTKDGCNLITTGSAKVTGSGDSCTVEYHEKIKTEIPVPRLLAGFVRGLVSKEVSSGIAAYVKASKRALES